MSIFNSESENDRFERHMKPIRLLNENRRLKLIRDELKKDLQLQRKMLRAKKSEQAILEQELKTLLPSIRATSETPAISGFAGARKIGTGVETAF